MTKIVFLDTETTSLRHDRRAWEIALIERRIVADGHGGVDLAHDDVETTFLIDSAALDLGNADLMSLKIGKFFDRHPFATGDPTTTIWSEYRALIEIEHMTRGAILVGAVPNFDTEVLGNRMRAHGICPSWHYHLVDVETLAAGALRQSPPWGFDDLLAAYGLEYDEDDRHTALGDTRMVRDLYDAIMTQAEVTLA